MKVAQAIALAVGAVPGTLPAAASVAQIDSPTKSPEIRLSHPHWLPAKLSGNYPGRAQYFEKDGGATVRCTLDQRLKPSGCVVVREQPVGFGFGEATIKIVQQLQATTASSPGDVFEYPMKWRLSG